MNLGDDELRRCETELRALQAMPGAAALLNERLRVFLQSAGTTGSTITFTMRNPVDRWIVENNYKVNDIAKSDSTQCTVHATANDNTKERKTITINGTTEWMMQSPYYVDNYSETTAMWNTLCAGTGVFEVEEYNDCIFYLKKKGRQLVFQAMHKLGFNTPDRDAWSMLHSHYGFTDNTIPSSVTIRCYLSFTASVSANGKKTIIINGITFTTNADANDSVWNELLTGKPSSVLDYDENGFSVRNSQTYSIRFEKQQ